MDELERNDREIERLRETERYNLRMSECRRLQKHYKLIFEAMLIMSLINGGMMLMDFITESAAGSRTFEADWIRLVHVLVPTAAGLWASLKQSPLVLLPAAAIVAAAALILLKPLSLIYTVILVGLYFATRGIDELKKDPAYPGFADRRYE